MNNQYTIAHYLKDRLEELGLDRMFGVAGNYTAALLDTILVEDNPKITISGNANELCAGYAADAYARTKGIGAIYVTYSVGAFVALNTIAGAYVEQSPVVLINGAPTNKEDSLEKNAGILYSHTTGYQFVDIHMFRPITAAAERITNAQQATFQIDSALTALLTSKRPVYLEVAEDVWRVPCIKPQYKLKSGAAAINTNNKENIKNAVKATLKLIEERPKTIFWAGIELQRYGLEDDFLDLLAIVNQNREEKDRINFITSPMSKSVISERHPYFKGCKTMSLSHIKEMVGDEGCVIGIGAWTIGKDVHNQNIRSDGMVLAANGGVLAGATYHPMVDLKSFIAHLKEEILKANLLKLSLPEPGYRLSIDTSMTYDNFYGFLGSWLTEDEVVVVDAGFPLLGAQSMPIPARGGFLCQAAWLSIGFSVGASTGVKCARPDKRVITVVGDGAFHETCQAMSDQAAYGHNTVVFVINNGVYGIEQFIVNPNPYRKPVDTYDGDTSKDSLLLQDMYSYNELHNWNFVKLAEAFGAKGRTVKNTMDLATVLEEIRADKEGHYLVEICVPKTDMPSSLTGPAQHPGEDEIKHKNWPPAGKF